MSKPFIQIVTPVLVPLRSFHCKESLVNLASTRDVPRHSITCTLNTESGVLMYPLRSLAMSVKASQVCVGTNLVLIIAKLHERGNGNPVSTFYRK